MDDGGAQEESYIESYYNIQIINGLYLAKKACKELSPYNH